MPPQKTTGPKLISPYIFSGRFWITFLLFLTNQVPLFAIVTIGVPSPFANVSIWGPNSPLFVNKV